MKMQSMLIKILSVVFLLPSIASAATLSISAEPNIVGVGDSVNLTVFIDSTSPVNAFAGLLKCSDLYLKPLRVDDGSSIVSAWITRPTVSDAGIDFAGITPGGFVGASGKLFSAVYKALSEGTATCDLREIEVLRNDGEGTKEPVHNSPLMIIVKKEPTGGFQMPADSEAPESFTVYRGQNEALFDGHPYLTFTALDKQSGMNHYEVLETRLPLWLQIHGWKSIGTTYMLEDSYGTSDVYIKAVDNADNERVEILHRSHVLRPYEQWLLITVIVLLSCILLWRRFLRVRT